MASLIVQLARLGDLLQTLPAITSLTARYAGERFDLLCASTLTDIVSLFHGTARAVPWEADQWQQWALGWTNSPDSTMTAAQDHIHQLAAQTYDTVYNLNQHPRAILAAHLLGRRVVGPGSAGPLYENLPPWGTYLRKVARDRSANHVHLADAFCGLCGVMPPGRVPRITPHASDLPGSLEKVGDPRYHWVAVIIGAGDLARCLPPAIWARWITALLNAHTAIRVVLIGSSGEIGRSRAIQETLSPLLWGRVWDATGHTNLLQLALLLSRCHWTIGSDTGSLHLAAAVGCRTLGLYFARARVHETGPYGDQHRVWQSSTFAPDTWPIDESLDFIVAQTSVPQLTECTGWQLWEGHVDEWGMSYSRPGQSNVSVDDRMAVWKHCMSMDDRENVLL
ncbi:MAG: glycosyltransferase family 9 protein [Nitrospira sp.]|nr:glycosyltransferase family 9 protein [Nitrospira sp.]